MNNKSDFYKRLNQLMEERRMTVREAARAAGVPVSTVQNWRSGHAPNNFEAVLKLSHALEVPFSFLLTGRNDRQPNLVPSITECFSEDGIVFDGYARIKIEKLVPR